jgi:hypothetical protein
MLGQVQIVTAVLLTKIPATIEATAFLLSSPSNHTHGGSCIFSKHPAIIHLLAKFNLK